MKKTLLLIVVCTFAFINAQAQSSEVETNTQLTKTEQFKAKSDLIKEATIYECEVGGSVNGVVMCANLFTDLKSSEQIAALQFSNKTTKESFGYLDMERVNELLLTLETILNEANKSDKKDKFIITYTTPGGIDVLYNNDAPLVGRAVIFRKKWLTVNDFGLQTYTYSTTPALLPLNGLPKLISSIKEAQTIAKQSLGQ